MLRDEWGAFDLTTAEGLKVEVKSAAYLQSWYQSRLSSISFRTPKTQAFNAITNVQSRESKRQAEVYVFALLAHKDKLTLDPLDVSQWQFYGLPSSVLDGRARSQHSITLKTWERLSGGPVYYFHLCDSVRRVVGERTAVMSPRAGTARP